MKFNSKELHDMNAVIRLFDMGELTVERISPSGVENLKLVKNRLVRIRTVVNNVTNKFKPRISDPNPNSPIVVLSECRHHFAIEKVSQDGVTVRYDDLVQGSLGESWITRRTLITWEMMSWDDRRWAKEVRKIIQWIRSMQKSIDSEEREIRERLQSLHRQVVEAEKQLAKASDRIKKRRKPSDRNSGTQEMRFLNLGGQLRAKKAVNPPSPR